MRLTLTAEEFLAVWRLRRGLEPLRSDCRVTRSDGIDLKALERMAMEAWFARQLREAPSEMLAPADISAAVSTTAMPDGSATIRLPDTAVRVVAVEMSGWARPAIIVSNPDHPLYAAQLNSYSRGGPNAPVAVALQGTLRLYTPAPDSQLTKLLVIEEPSDGTYSFDSSLLDSIPKFTDFI